MNILAFETCFNGFTIALEVDGKLYYSNDNGIAHSQAEQLIPSIAKLLAKADIAHNDLNYIALNNGPGSFTGVRVGVAAAKGYGLALGTNKPIFITHTSLEIAAYQALHNTNLAQADIAIKAVQDKYYYQKFEYNDDALQATNKPQVVSAGELPKNAIITDKIDARDLLGLAKLNTRSAANSNDLQPFYLREHSARVTN